MREINESEPENPIEAANNLRKLIASQQTLLLSTASPNGIPDISYAPFVRDPSGHFFIFVSELAGHTANLLKNPKASVMFVRPESESRNLYARERAVFNCSVREIAPNQELHTSRLQDLQDKFGQVVEILRSLSDFHLFELCPENGRYIAGFGRAFTINISDGTLTLAPVNRKK